MYPGEYIDKAIMRTFLKKKLVDAKVIVLTPDYADLNKLYRQVAALVRWGRKARIISVKLK
jgi:NifB/MoaA-like Fe-S oxidoreductase